jgi:hypothetical protein
VCLAIGLLLWVASFFTLVMIVLHPERFAIIYTLGNVVSLAGTFFLIGPMRQLKSTLLQLRTVCFNQVSTPLVDARVMRSRRRTCTLRTWCMLRKICSSQRDG